MKGLTPIKWRQTQRVLLEIMKRKAETGEITQQEYIAWLRERISFIKENTTA